MAQINGDSCLLEVEGVGENRREDNVLQTCTYPNLLPETDASPGRSSIDKYIYLYTNVSADAELVSET